jgi:hypothetical protein
MEPAATFQLSAEWIKSMMADGRAACTQTPATQARRLAMIHEE